MLLSTMMDYTLTAAPLRKNIPFVPRQETFAVNVAKLIMFISANGYQVTLGETIRTQAQADIYAKKGIGIRDSNHCYRLAIDLNLFKDGKYLTQEKDYKFAGVYWQSLNKFNEWGGRFKDVHGHLIGDFGHFEAD
jgi:hypothetical protein